MHHPELFYRAIAVLVLIAVALSLGRRHYRAWSSQGPVRFPRYSGEWLTVEPARFLFLEIGSHHDYPFEQCSRIDNEAYAKSHGYTFKYVTVPETSSVAMAQFYRYQVLMDVVPLYDAVLYTDSDAVVINCKCELHKMVPKSSPLVVTPDIHKTRKYYSGHFGSGFMIIRNEPGVVECLHNIWHRNAPSGCNLTNSDQECIAAVVAAGNCPVDVQRYHDVLLRDEPFVVPQETSFIMLHGASRAKDWRDKHMCQPRCR